MATRIVHVEFHGAELIGRLHQGQPFVAMRPIVEGMGLGWQKQLEKIHSHPVLSRQLQTLRGMTGADGKRYTMACLPLSRLPFWLATVNPNKVKAAIRERVILFQEQAADVLAATFASDGARQDVAMAKRVAGTVMCRILHDALVAVGRDPKGYDYATEHRLVNHCLTGVFGGITEGSLSTDQLKLQQELRMQNAVWIGQGIPYRDRKPRLERHAAIWDVANAAALEAPNGA